LDQRPNIGESAAADESSPRIGLSPAEERGKRLKVGVRERGKKRFVFFKFLKQRCIHIHKKNVAFIQIMLVGFAWDWML
jgi:hypothetical protein